MSQISTTPSQVQQSPVGSLNYAIDLSAQLDSGETPSAPAVTIYDLAGGTVASLPAPTVANTGSANGDPVWTWRLTLAGNKLTAGHTYRLVGTYTASTGKQPTFEVIILCLDPTRGLP